MGGYKVFQRTPSVRNRHFSKDLKKVRAEAVLCREELSRQRDNRVQAPQGGSMLVCYRNRMETSKLEKNE